MWILCNLVTPAFFLYEGRRAESERPTNKPCFNSIQIQFYPKVTFVLFNTTAQCSFLWNPFLFSFPVVYIHSILSWAKGSFQMNFKTLQTKYWLECPFCSGLVYLHKKLDKRRNLRSPCEKSAVYFFCHK